jgi:hypothetical protein
MGIIFDFASIERARYGAFGKKRCKGRFLFDGIKATSKPEFVNDT